MVHSCTTNAVVITQGFDHRLVLSRTSSSSLNQDLQHIFDDLRNLRLSEDLLDGRGLSVRHLDAHGDSPVLNPLALSRPFDQAPG